MQIPPEKIQEILERTDIVALISRHVDLKKSGRSFKGLCPFHNEKGPSFYVTPGRGYKCFGCEEGGDAISFLKRYSGKTFLDAVRELAKDAGIALDEREDPAAIERSHAYEANETARKHFEERLWTGETGKLGREHLAARGVTEEVARAFSLGYAVNSWNDLCTRFVRDGILEWALKGGLCAPRTRTEGYYDVFRGRLMVPIRSPEGRCIAFGARLIEEQQRADGDKGPKYLNSRESPVYRKSETLYAMDLAKDDIRRRKSAILVEGYFDVIGMHSAGVKNVVALCSTALTAGHLATLARYDAKELVLLLDGDDAGVKAVERLAGPILAAGVTARVATLPPKDDPDTFAMREGKEAVEKLIESAPPLTTHLLDRALPRRGASAWEEKVAALGAMKPVLEQMPAGIERTMFISQIASHLGVAESEVKSHLVAEQKPQRVSRPVPMAAPSAQKITTLDTAEEWFAALLISDPMLRTEADARFLDEILSLEVRMLLVAEKPEEGLATLADSVRKPLEKRLAEIARDLGGPAQLDGRRKALSEASRALRLNRIDERIREKLTEMRDAEKSHAPEEEVERVQAEYMELSVVRTRLTARGIAGVAGRAAPAGSPR